MSERKIIIDGKPVFTLKSEQRLTLASKNKVPTQVQYELCLDDIATLRLSKVIDYGESMYNEPNHKIALIGVYADIRRKYQRFQRLVETYLDAPSDELLTKLNDTFMDLANYGIMGYQINLSKLEKDKSHE